MPIDGPNQKFSWAQLVQMLKGANVPDASANIMAAIAIAESGGNSGNHNPNAGTGDNSYGLFQINMLGNLGPARLRAYGLSSNADLYNPLTNIRVAAQMSNYGRNLGAWTTYTSGAYRQYLNNGNPLPGAGQNTGPTGPNLGGGLNALVGGVGDIVQHPTAGTIFDSIPNAIAGFTTGLNDIVLKMMISAIGIGLILLGFYVIAKPQIKDAATKVSMAAVKGATAI